MQLILEIIVVERHLNLVELEFRGGKKKQQSVWLMIEYVLEIKETKKKNTEHLVLTSDFLSFLSWKERFEVGFWPNKMLGLSHIFLTYTNYIYENHSTASLVEK